MKKSADYKALLSGLEIKSGDCLNVSSDILQLICVLRDEKIQFEPNALIETLQDLVGLRGTLLFPTFNWNYCQGETFNYRSTKAQTGALSNAALARKDFRRTRHPIYSFAVWGRNQNELCTMNPRGSFSEDSVFGYFYRHHAKNLFIGKDYKLASAYVHYAEEMVGVSYRYFKDFTAPYIDENGVESRPTYTMYVRNWDVITEITPAMDKVLRDRGLYSSKDYKGVYLGLVDVRGALEVMMKDIKEQGGLVVPAKV